MTLIKGPPQPERIQAAPRAAPLHALAWNEDPAFVRLGQWAVQGHGCGGLDTNARCYAFVDHCPLAPMDPREMPQDLGFSKSHS